MHEIFLPLVSGEELTMIRGEESASDLEERAATVFEILRKRYRNARVALNFNNPLEILVATILSAQCTDAKVNEVTAPLFQRYRTAEDYASAPPGELERYIHATGFFNQKAKSLRGLGRALVERHGGEVPRTMAEMVEIPGVARKTANVVLGNAYGIVEGIAVDTHVRRLSQRMDLSRRDDPADIEQDLMALLPRERWFRATYLLIDHGRRVCQAKRPACDRCPVGDLCPRRGL